MKRLIVSLALLVCVGGYTGEASAQLGLGPLLGPIVVPVCDSSEEVCEVLAAVCDASPDLCTLLFTSGPGDGDEDGISDDLEDQLCPLQVPALDQFCCPHSPCDIGDPLHESCNACSATVCDVDPYCCEVDWDSQCSDEAAELCDVCQ